MKRFVQGMDRGQSTLLPECLDDWISDEHPVRVIDAIVDSLDLMPATFLIGDWRAIYTRVG